MKYYVNVSAIGTYWYKDVEMTIFHREDGPAVEYPDGDKAWYLNGLLHREDGPALERSNGDKAWWLNGQLHRVDGPAIEWADGYKAWYLNGIRMTEEEHRQQTQPAVELTVADIEKLLGKKIKIVK